MPACRWGQRATDWEIQQISSRRAALGSWGGLLLVWGGLLLGLGGLLQLSAANMLWRQTHALQALWGVCVCVSEMRGKFDGHADGGG